MREAKEAEEQLQFEATQTRPTTPDAPSRSTRITAGKPALKLSDDPAYTGLTLEVNLTIAEALESPEASDWRKAMSRELAQLEKYGVYEWVDNVPAGAKIVDTKWVVRIKEEKPLHDPKRFKARLTARGFSQRAGVDYDIHGTYAPVCREESWRLLITISLKEEMTTKQYDIEAAFLNGELTEELYVKDPHVTGQRAWRLKKGLYGTKQAAHNWNKKLHEVLTSLGFFRCPDDPGLYYRPSDRGMIVVHVDDLLASFRNREIMTIWEEQMNKHFTLEDRGTPKRLLGMDLIWGDDQVIVTGASSIKQLAKDEGITRIAKSPFTTTGEESDPIPIKPFQAVTGKLLFIARMWRPDIRYAVQRLCMRASAPTISDKKKADRVISYLLATPNEGIALRKFNHPIDVYTDAGEEKLDDKATTGILILSGKSPIGWASRKQDVTTLSSTEAEYIALSHGAQDGVWLQKVLHFLELNAQAPRVWTDSAGADTLSYNPDYHRQTKHIRRRHHFIRECVENKELTVHWVPGNENPADMLTKPLDTSRIRELKVRAGMNNPLSG